MQFTIYTSNPNALNHTTITCNPHHTIQLLYYIHTTPIAITTTQWSYIQFMQAFRICTTALAKKTITTTITQCNLQYYVHHLKLLIESWDGWSRALTSVANRSGSHACIHYMHHCSRKNDRHHHHTVQLAIILHPPHAGTNRVMC